MAHQAKLYEIGSVEVAGRRFSGPMLRCSSCTNTETIRNTSNLPNMPPVLASKKFSQLGWEVGHNARHHKCPTCIRLEREQRRERHRDRNGNRALESEIITKVLSPVPQETAAMPTPTNPPKPVSLAQVRNASDEPPREMTRQDRQVVFAKLMDVYVSESEGYSVGWTDQRVATDLGVPVAWVAKVRDENFGPARDNAEIRQLLADSKAAARDAMTLLTEAKKINGLMTELITKVTDLQKIADRITKQVQP
jgi:hypothetical protein